MVKRAILVEAGLWLLRDCVLRCPDATGVLKYSVMHAPAWVCVFLFDFLFPLPFVIKCHSVLPHFILL
jgi:hypothetical protein